MKKCSKCGVVKQATTEYFYKNNNGTQKLKSECKECTKERVRKYTEDNIEKIKEYKKEYREKNKEKIAQSQKEYREKNKDEIKIKKQVYYQENKDYIKNKTNLYRKENEEWKKEYDKQYAIDNKKKISKYQKDYYEKNKPLITKYKKIHMKKKPEIYTRATNKRKALKNKLENSLTIEQWEQIRKDFKYQCAYCGMSEDNHINRYNQQLHQEHFIPLSNGGEYTHNNIIPSCRVCNNHKHGKDFFEWYPTYKHYDKDRENSILEYLGYEKNNQQLSIL